MLLHQCSIYTTECLHAGTPWHTVSLVFDVNAASTPSRGEDMKRLLLAAGIAGALLVPAAGSAWAAQPDPGTPGTPNCHGNFISFVSSNGLNNPAQESKLTGTPVQVLQSEVR